MKTNFSAFALVCLPPMMLHVACRIFCVVSLLLVVLIQLS